MLQEEDDQEEDNLKKWLAPIVGVSTVVVLTNIGPAWQKLYNLGPSFWKSLVTLSVWKHSKVLLEGNFQDIYLP